MNVIVLGCGSSTGVPAIGGRDGAGDWGACDAGEPRNRRTRASLVIDAGQGGRLLIDTGPDLRAQLLACRIPRIDGILFTHAHADHIVGLDDVRVLNRIAGRPLPAWAMPATRAELERRFDYAFRPWQPPGFFRPVLQMTSVEAGDAIDILTLRLQTFAQDHEVTTTLGFRIGGFAYSTDVVRLPESSLAALAGTDTWLVDCFQRRPHATHAHLAQVLEWRTQLGVRRTILTHLGPDMDWAWMARNLPPDVEPAFDGMVLSGMVSVAAAPVLAAG